MSQEQPAVDDAAVRALLRHTDEAMLEMIERSSDLPAGYRELFTGGFSKTCDWPKDDVTFISNGPPVVLHALLDTGHVLRITASSGGFHVTGVIMPDGTDWAGELPAALTVPNLTKRKAAAIVAALTA